MSSFEALGIRAELVSALKEQRIEEPTPVQDKAIPIVLSGQDVTAQAQTGTGKTLAFLLPIFEKIRPERSVIQTLIVTPTRELAIQITAEAEKLLQFLEDIHVLAVYGGQDVEKQINRLKRNVHMVVGTPGRILDHVRRGTIDLSEVSMLVLDEADQMLQLGFLPEVEDVIRQTPSTRQTMLFSATMPSQIRTLMKRYTKNANHIRIQARRVAVETVKQRIVQTTDRTKQETLRRLVDEERPYLAIIFCRTRRRAKALCDALQGQGYLADELHGDLSQSARENVIKRFRRAEIQLLVATDVAARGLDVEGVTHVFNYDIPHDVESYIHRIGRTGRAGEEGIAITLAAPKDNHFVALIEKGIHQSIERDDSLLVQRKMRIHAKTPDSTTARTAKKPGSAKAGPVSRRRSSKSTGMQKTPNNEAGRRGRSRRSSHRRTR